MAPDSGRPEKSGATGGQQPYPDLSRWGTAQAEGAVAMQREILGICEQMSSAWIARMQSEADLWSDLARKLQGIHSLPEALVVYQECMTRRAQMAADDGRQMIENGQKIMDSIRGAVSARLPMAGT